MLTPETRAAIAADAAELAAIRQDIHAHPELGMTETRTAGVVAERLRAWGIPFTEGVGGTGLVATIKGRNPGQRAIGIRCDMDALAIPEQTGAAHASTIPGLMHACGHDGHTAMLLGAAKQLAANPDFSGTVNLIFQPGEEGCGGAEAMLDDGLFERFPCDAVYGMHNWPGLPLGRFALRPGPMMAAGGRWYITVTGTGGHGGATPHLSTDVTVAQAQIVMALQTVVSRNVPPLESAVVSVGSIHGGSEQSSNVMPSEIRLTGTMRCFNRATQDIISARMEALARSTAEAHGCTAVTAFDWFAHALSNTPENTDVAIAAAAAVTGADNVDGNVTPTTGGEDFAYMLERKPGAFIFMGTRADPDAPVQGLHTPRFDFNDDAIPLGVAYWVSLVQQELKLTT